MEQHVRPRISALRQDFKRQWAILSDRKGFSLITMFLHLPTEIQFTWPPDCPLEVRELVGPENFDSSNPKYTMPFFWRSDAVPATRSWLPVKSLIV